MKLSLKPAAAAIALAAALSTPAFAEGDQPHAGATTPSSSVGSTYGTSDATSPSTSSGTGTSTYGSGTASGDLTGSRNLEGGAIDDRAGTLRDESRTRREDRETSRSYGNSGVSTSDRTGMTGADAGSTALRGGVVDDTLDNPVYAETVPLMTPHQPERFSMQQRGIKPNSPFDSEVTTMGQSPL